MRLKNCPYCGEKIIFLSTAKYRETTGKRKYRQGFRFYCKKCKATTKTYDTEKEAREAWNMRCNDEICTD